MIKSPAKSLENVLSLFQQAPHRSQPYLTTGAGPQSGPPHHTRNSSAGPHLPVITLGAWPTHLQNCGKFKFNPYHSQPCVATPHNLLHLLAK